MLKIFFYAEDKLQTEVSKEELVDIIKQKKGLLWLDINDPTEEEIDMLVDEFNFHPLAIEDCIFPQNHPKINDFGSHIFMVFHAVACSNDNICTSELDLFLGENYLVTLHSETIKSIVTIFEKIKSNPIGISKGVDFLLYNILDSIMDTYFPILENMDEKIDQIDDELANSPTSEIMHRIFSLKKSTLSMRKILGPQQSVLNVLTKRDFPFIKSDIAIYFKDIYDHASRIYSIIETYRDMLISSMEVYHLIVSNRLNEVMKTLTIIATFMMPLTLVTSFYGMNVKAPEFEWGRASYIFVWCIMILTTIVMYSFFRKKRWL